ncbi:MAG TPA: hypothetical protein VGU20_06345 [Stellaceae bacterium]|nr:hypothetical protein [Stellaceae bacterium]
MSRKAPFRIVGISALAIIAAVTTAAAGDKAKKRQMILPPADATAERLQAHPRVPVEAAPLSGTIPSLGAVADSAPQHADPTSARACASSKMSRAECAQLAARIDRFMNERKAAARAPTASDVCRKPAKPASRCAAYIAQIAAWLKTRQTAEAAPRPALAGSTSDR